MNGVFMINTVNYLHLNRKCWSINKIWLLTLVYRTFFIRMSVTICYTHHTCLIYSISCLQAIESLFFLYILSVFFFEIHTNTVACVLMVLWMLYPITIPKWWKISLKLTNLAWFDDEKFEWNEWCVQHFGSNQHWRTGIKPLYRNDRDILLPYIDRPLNRAIKSRCALSKCL